MKPILLIQLTLLLLSYNVLSQNQILVGQTSGDNIHYTNFEPDYIVDLNDIFLDTVLLDVDNNGVFDLAIFVYVHSHDPNYATEFRSCLKILNDNVKVVADNSAFHYVKKLSIGDTISANQDWSDADLLHFRREYISYWPPPGHTNIYGEFGNGHLGFKIEKQGETFYGWIKINAYFVSITIEEMAICGETVGFLEDIEHNESIRVFPNPCNDFIYIQHSNTIQNLRILDQNGNLVQQVDKVYFGKPINISDLPIGLYFLSYQEGSRTNMKKFIKAE